MESITITREAVDAIVRERILAVLPDNVVRGIARQLLRKQLGALTLREAARWLKWKDANKLRLKLRGAGVRGFKTGSQLTFAIPDLVAFRERFRQPKAGGQRSEVRGQTRWRMAA